MCLLKIQLPPQDISLFDASTEKNPSTTEMDFPVIMFVIYSYRLPSLQAAELTGCHPALLLQKGRTPVHFQTAACNKKALV